MERTFGFTSMDRIMSKLHRDLRGMDLNEMDIIEWTGEALDFLKMPEALEEAVDFLEVRDYETCLPTGLHMILQIARYNGENFFKDCCRKRKGGGVDEGKKDGPRLPVPIDCMGMPMSSYDVAYYRPFEEPIPRYLTWVGSQMYRGKFTPVRLANNTFFNSVVCKERMANEIYRGCTDEYTIVGTTEKRLRFSFKEGMVAISYLKQSVDGETGYPLIPDIPSVIQAITYYVKWKLSEWLHWNGKYGTATLAENNMNLWLHYVRQAKNYMKMPKSMDAYQNLLEESHYLIPRLNRYYGYFGKLGRPEDRPFIRR